MDKKRIGVLTLALGVMLTSTAGCQTWVPEAAITLPTWRYLDHPPTYIPPSPAYPLPKELNSLEEAAAKLANPSGKMGVGP